MESLRETVASALVARFDAFLDQAGRLTSDLTDEEFWRRPYPYGNSAGHLLLHVTGNLNYYIGTQIARTGYLRDRDREFNDTSHMPKQIVLDALAEAVQMVTRTIRAQSDADWSAPYEAVGTDEVHRFGIVLRCTHHFHHHLGQIIYLAREHAVRRAAS